MLFPGSWSRQFTRQLAFLLEEGVSLFKALELVGVQQRGRAGRRIVDQIRVELREGAPLSRALSHHPRQFKRHYVETIRWAEGTGSSENLALALRLLAGDTGQRTPR